MTSTYEAIAGGVAHFVQSWVLPSAIATGATAFFLFPEVDDREPFSSINRLGATERLVLILMIVLATAVVLSSVAIPLYRVLEGYRLPKRLKDKRTTHFKAERKKLRDSVATASAIERGQIREQLDGYPRSERYVMPTQLGNALRSGESYGRHQYGLDTTLLWGHLVSVADEQTRDALTRCRTLLDFYAGVFWLSPCFAALSIATACLSGSWGALLGTAAILLCPFAYAGTVRSARAYGTAMRALVDTSRVDLAARLGLTIPASLESERAMWSAFSDLSSWGPGWSHSAKWIEQLDSARKSPPPQPADASGGSGAGST